MLRRCLFVAMVAGFSIGAVCSTAASAHAQNATVSSVTVRTLAQAPVKQLPAKPFATILEWSQVPGVACGQPCQLPGFVYTLHGVATITSPGAATRSVGPGDAAFTPALTVHTNGEVARRDGAVAIAVGLIVIVILLCAGTWLRVGLRRAIIPLLSLLLIVGGVLVVRGAASNDWYFFAVRPGFQRSLPMPRPDGWVIFASPDVDPVPAGPYIETLSAITVPPSARYDALDGSGPETIIVLEGTATLHIGDQTRHVESGHATFAQAGQKVAIVNPGSDTLRVIAFAVTSQSP